MAFLESYDEGLGGRFRSMARTGRAFTKLATGKKKKKKKRVVAAQRAPVVPTLTLAQTLKQAQSKIVEARKESLRQGLQKVGIYGSQAELTAQEIAALDSYVGTEIVPKLKAGVKLTTRNINVMKILGMPIPGVKVTTKRVKVTSLRPTKVKVKVKAKARTKPKRISRGSSTKRRRAYIARKEAEATKPKRVVKRIKASAPKRVKTSRKVRFLKRFFKKKMLKPALKARKRKTLISKIDPRLERTSSRRRSRRSRKSSSELTKWIKLIKAPATRPAMIKANLYAKLPFNLQGYYVVRINKATGKSDYILRTAAEKALVRQEAKQRLIAPPRKRKPRIKGRFYTDADFNRYSQQEKAQSLAPRVLGKKAAPLTQQTMPVALPTQQLQIQPKVKPTLFARVKAALTPAPTLSWTVQTAVAFLEQNSLIKEVTRIKYLSPNQRRVQLPLHKKKVASARKFLQKKQLDALGRPKDFIQKRQKEAQIRNMAKAQLRNKSFMRKGRATAFRADEVDAEVTKIKARQQQPISKVRNVMEIAKQVAKPVTAPTTKIAVAQADAVQFKKPLVLVKGPTLTSAKIQTAKVAEVIKTEPRAVEIIKQDLLQKGQPRVVVERTVREIISGAAQPTQAMVAAIKETMPEALEKVTPIIKKFNPLPLILGAAGILFLSLKRT